MYDAQAEPVRVGMAAPPPQPDTMWTHPLMHRLLRSLDQVRDIDRHRPWLLDTLVVLLAAAAAPPDLLARDSADAAAARLVAGDLPVVVVLLCGALLAVPLWWRRRAPALVATLLLPIGLLLWSLGLGAAGASVVLIALFNLALHGSVRAILATVPLSVVCWVLAVCLLIPTSNPPAFIVLSIGTGVAAIALGLAVRIHRMYLSALQDKAIQMRTEHEQRIRLAAASERTRIAHDMHDIVGHNLSIMVSLADGAAALVNSDPARARQALQIIGDTGREAMDELRRVLGVLRDPSEPDAPRAPQPGISDLDNLVSRVRAAGLPVEYRTNGNIASAGPGIQLATYRIVQEALTNTLKHVGTTATSAVTLDATDTRLHVQVTDTGGPATPRGAPTNDSGQGLTGIRQRAALYDGSVSAGPNPNGTGWTVDVEFTLPSQITLGGTTS